MDLKNYILIFKLLLLSLKGFKILEFKGNNILDFLEKYKDLYNDYKVTFKIKRERIIQYITLSLKDLVKAILKY